MEVGVDRGVLDVVEVGVVLERALQQPGLLAQGGDVRPVVVREHLVAHDGVGHLKTNIAETNPVKTNLGLTCGAAMRFISRSLVCSGPSAGLLFLRASRRKAVHCCTMFCSMNTSTICVMSASGSESATSMPANCAPFSGLTHITERSR